MLVYGIKCDSAVDFYNMPLGEWVDHKEMLLKKSGQEEGYIERARKVMAAYGAESCQDLENYGTLGQWIDEQEKAIKRK